MKNLNEEKKYEDRMEHGNSKFMKNIYQKKILSIEYSYISLREKINEETLSLRKNRHKQELFSRRANFKQKPRNLICPLKLNGIPDNILEKFRINNKNLDDSIITALKYLNSEELDEIKFGAFLFRWYFAEIIKKEEECNNNNRKFIFYLDEFIDKKIIEIFGKVLYKETSIDILSELIWALLNISNYGTKMNGYAYLREFMNQTYSEIFYKIVNIEDSEIRINFFEFLTNCILESADFAKFVFSNEIFMKLCINKYLESTLDQDVKKSMLDFFLSLSIISNIFNEKQKNIFYKIYSKIIEIKMFDPDIIIATIKGLGFLFCLDQSEKKIIFNIIKDNNYDLFNKIFQSLQEIISKYQDFDKLDIIIHNILIIIKHFISLSEENDIIFILQNTDVLNFIEAFYNQIYFKNVKNELLEILVLLSQHTSSVVLNMIKGRDILVGDIIKGTLNSNNFDIRMKGILIIFYMLSLNSIDINIILYRNGIIENLISISLLNEIEQKCLTKILNGILLFINSIKPLEKQWKVEIINNLIKIGITNGLESDSMRFNEEHNIIINQIKNEIDNILDNNNNANNNINEKNNLTFINNKENDQNQLNLK